MLGSKIVQEKYGQPLTEFMSGVFWSDCEHINIADLFAADTHLPTARRANWNTLVANETEAVRVKIGLVNNVVVSILNGSADVYKCCVHD